MTTIRLMAEDQMLSKITNPKISSGDVNSVLIHVEFSEEWTGYAKSAVFFNSNDATPNEVVMTNNECMIPPEVIAKPCVLFIGIRGVNSDDNSVKTTLIVKHKIYEGPEAGKGSEIEPTPNVYQQLLTAYGKTDAAIEKEVAERKAAITAEESERKNEIAVERERINNIINEKSSGLEEYKITELYLNNVQYNNDGSNYFIKASNPVFAGNSENIGWGTTSKDVRVLNVGVHFSDTKYTVDSHYEKVGEDSDYVYSSDTGATVEYREVESDEYDHAWYYTCFAGYYADPPGLYANFRVLVAYSVDADNTELEDIRVGADGVNYPSAGEAVRNQFKNIKDQHENDVTQLRGDLVDFIKTNSLEKVINASNWVIGGYIGPDGNISDQHSGWSYNTDYFKIGSDARTIYMSGDVQYFYIHEYDYKKNWLRRTAFLADGFYTVGEDCSYIRFDAGFTNGNTMTQELAETVSLNYVYGKLALDMMREGNSDVVHLGNQNIYFSHGYNVYKNTDGKISYVDSDDWNYTMSNAHYGLKYTITFKVSLAPNQPYIHLCDSDDNVIKQIYSSNGDRSIDTKTFIVDDKRITKMYIGSCDLSNSQTAISVYSEISSIDDKEISILFIGNSLTQDGIAYLPYLLKNYYPNVRFKFYMWYNAGKTLNQQYSYFSNDTVCDIFSVSENTSSWINYNSSVKMSEILSMYKFDIVCMQEYFNDRTSWDSSYFTDWNNCRDYITSHYLGGNALEFISLFHAPKRNIADSVFSLTKIGNANILKNTVSQDMIPIGISVYRALSTNLDNLGDQGHLSPDGTHTQEGLPCLLQTYTALLWLLDKLNINKSIYGCSLRMTTDIYDSINVPGPNLGTGVITGTDEENLIAQEVAIKSYKEGKHFVYSNIYED